MATDSAGLSGAAGMGGRVRVKICGITRASDADAAAAAGADALGFVFWEGSPRRVSPDLAAGLSADLPPEVDRVGVFVNAGRESLLDIAKRARINVAQLHGDEEPGFCRVLGLDWYRAFRVGPEAKAGAVAAEVAAFGAQTFMLDTRAAGSPGGTGVALDWKVAGRISVQAALAGCPRLILAGGLTPSNVQEAIRMVRPWAVDVSTGVESAPGVKDPALIRAFVDAVRGSR